MSLYVKRDVPFPLFEIALDGASDQELITLSSESGVGLSLDEMKRIRDYFVELGRNPTDIEFESIGQAWSEHCCYKSSKTILKEFVFGIDNPRVLSRGDAGVMEFDDEHAYALRIESHNHPSAIGPYGGAATGIGGIVRDVLCMGAQPIALIDPLFFGPLDLPFEELPKGIKHPRYLLNGVVGGIRDYGNRIGIPTVCGGIYFDPAYTGNCLVNVGCVGIARKEDIQENAVGGVGDNMLLVGGRTGRDGIHGVTFASAEIDEGTEEESRGAVQLGDPITKEPVIHACLEVVRRKLNTGMKDLGGGGLSCVCGEMALARGFGVEVHLDRVPLKEEGLAPWEIWVSESQERMMLAVSDERLEEVKHIFKLYDVEATVVGKVVPEKLARLYFGGEKIFELDLEFLTAGPEYCRPMQRADPQVSVSEKEPEAVGPADVIMAMLSHPNIASRASVVRQYDHEVRGRTVLKPLAAPLGREAHQDAAVLKPVEGSNRGLALALGINPWLSVTDPYRGGLSLMDEVVRNLAAVGARLDSLTNCLNFGNPEKPDRLGQFYDVVRGMGEVAAAFDAPIPSGNVSFYNETPQGPILPTASVLGIGIVKDITKCVTTGLKQAGNPIYLVGETRDELGGSLFYRMYNGSSPVVPDVNINELKASAEAVVSAVEAGTIAACHDLSEGGLAVAAAEMSIASGLGAELDLSAIPDLSFEKKLFSESNTRWLCEVKDEERFLNIMSGRTITRLGSVRDGGLHVKDNGTTLTLPIDDMADAWRNGLGRWLA